MQPEEEIVEETVDSNTLSWVSTGRDYWTSSLFGHLLFLNTYFPTRWPQEFMKALRYIHPKRFYDDSQPASGDAHRIRACFYGMKYILGLYDWNPETSKAIEEFPPCYQLPDSSTEDIHKKNMEAFKDKVFPELWYTFATFSDFGPVRVCNMQLVDLTREAMKGKRFGVFSDLVTDLKDPYSKGLRFRFLEEMKVPIDVANRGYMRIMDLVGLLLCLDYAPMGHQKAKIIASEDLEKPEVVAMMEKLSFKHAIHNTFNGHHSSVWTMSKDKLEGFIRPDAVARATSTKTNGIYMYAALLRKISKSEERDLVISQDIWDKLEEVGFLDPALLEKDFGMIKKAKKRSTKKTENRTRTPQILEKPASISKTGAPMLPEQRKRLRNPFKGPERPKSSDAPIIIIPVPIPTPLPSPTCYQDPDIIGMPHPDPDPEPADKKQKTETPNWQLDFEDFFGDE
jgi:hypothetical protein